MILQPERFAIIDMSFLMRKSDFRSFPFVSEIATVRFHRFVIF